MLTEKKKLRDGAQFESADTGAPARSALAPIRMQARKSFLCIPPFPGARLQHFTQLQPTPTSLAGVVAETKRLRVGGTYWGAQPELPDTYILVRSPEAVEAARRLPSGDPIVLWNPENEFAHALPGTILITDECDPWYMLSSALALVAEPGDETRLIAALLEIPCHDFDRSSGRASLATLDATDLLGEALSESTFENPFTGEAMSALETVELCGFWRRLIDSNRDIAGGLGFAFWKQSHVAPLLWNGSTRFQFLRDANDAEAVAPVAIWRAKASPESIIDLERRGVPLIEVEDGFLRSHGLGADCIPPLSITVDRLGPYFDPSQPSELESMLEHGHFDDRVLARARELQRAIVEAGLGKYGHGVAPVDRPKTDRMVILVPGQVEDDRSVQSGGCGLVSNLELLARVRQQAPDAYIVYKPHPDVVAGHRRGATSTHQCLRFADEIVTDVPIAPLIAMVDEVHVNTSLAGFEALLRGKPVTTYGVPFYAGWGLTHDLGMIPERRTARRSVDELVAATLLIYPRYLDPVTGLPCPAEIVVARLSNGEHGDPGIIVGMRRLQGRIMRGLRSLVQ